MCLSTTVLETLSTTAKWECSNGCKVTAREMDKGHLGRLLGVIYNRDKNESYCGLTYGEWQEVMRYENNKRSDLSRLQQELKEAEAQLTVTTNDRHKALECLAKAEAMHSYASSRVISLQAELERCQ